MTIPSITSITPTIAPTGGGVLVEIFGDGFQLPAAATMAGPATRLAPTVAVRVGGRAASDVRVTAPGRLTCIVPPGDVGPADVVVQNVDVDGVVILGEQAVTLDAITYLRPALTVEADMTRLVRGLIHELKRQVLENVVLTVHTDFDDEAGAERVLGFGSEIAFEKIFQRSGSDVLVDFENVAHHLRQRLQAVRGSDHLAVGRYTDLNRPIAAASISRGSQCCSDLRGRSRAITDLSALFVAPALDRTSGHERTGMGRHRPRVRELNVHRVHPADATRAAQRGPGIGSGLP